MHRMGSHSFGELMIAQAILGYFTLFVEFGLGITGTREIARNNDTKKQKEILTTITIAKLFVLFILLLLTITIFFFGKITFSNQTKLISISLITVFFTAILPTWFLQGKERFDVIFYLQIPPRILSYILILFFIENENDLILSHILLGSSLSISSIASIIFVTNKYGYGRINLSKSIALLKTNFSIAFSTMISSVFTHGNTLLVGWIAGIESAGVFAYADKVIRSIIQITTPFTEITFPKIARKLNEDISSGLRLARQIANYGFLWFGLFSIALLIGISFYSNKLQGFMSVEILTCIVLLLPLPVLIFMNNVFGSQVLISLKGERLFLLGTILSAVITFGASSLLCAYFGVTGSAIGVLIGEISLCGIYYFFSTRLARKNWMFHANK